MKENVLDVLIFLFENNFNPESTQPLADRDSLTHDLRAAGFHPAQVADALKWLDALTADTERPVLVTGPRSMRIFDARECERLDVECRNYILYLENAGILDPTRRELVLERLLALEGAIELKQVKWVVLLVLFSQPEQELSFMRMESLVFETPVLGLH